MVRRETARSGGWEQERIVEKNQNANPPGQIQVELGEHEAEGTGLDIAATRVQLRVTPSRPECHHLEFDERFGTQVVRGVPEDTGFDTVGGLPPAMFLLLTGITFAFLMDSQDRIGAGNRPRTAGGYWSRERVRELRRERRKSSIGSRNTSNTTNNRIKSPNTAINGRL